MQTLAAAAWERVRHPRSLVGRALRRGALTAPGTYGAYLLYGLRHPALLRSTVTAAERDEALAGDHLVERPDWVTNFGIDIAAPPAQVWPWIVQLGYGRAGWYTWFPLDNGGVPSADAIIPALQTTAVGEVIPDGPRAAEGFGIWRVQALEPARSLVLYSRREPVSGREVTPGEIASSPFIECSWVFALLEPQQGRTRLRVRVRARFHARIKIWAHAARLLFGLGDNVMENTMLAGIRLRAERSV